MQTVNTKKHQTFLFSNVLSYNASFLQTYRDAKSEFTKTVMWFTMSQLPLPAIWNQNKGSIEIEQYIFDTYMRKQLS